MKKLTNKKTPLFETKKVVRDTGKKKAKREKKEKTQRKERKGERERNTG